jgi:WD40 repeat protein
VWTVAWSPDGKSIASATHEGRIRLWDPATGKERTGLKLALINQGMWNGVWSVAFRPDSQVLATATLDGLVRLWDVSPWGAKGE